MSESAALDRARGARCAAVDLGSNMFRLVVGARDKAGRTAVLGKWAEVVAVAEGLWTEGALGARPLARAAATLGRFREVLAGLPIERTRAVATGAFRLAANRGDACRALGSVLGCDVEVVDGEREAALAIEGVRTEAGEGARIGVIDVGGTSTEVVVEEDVGLAARSIDVGVITLSERCAVPLARRDERDAWLRDAAREALAPLERKEPPAVESFFATGGAAVAMAAHRDGVPYVTYRGDGARVLARRELDALYRDYAATDPQDRARRLGISEAHGNLVPAGYALLAAALDRLKIDGVIPTGRGVAEGLLSSMLRTMQ